MKLIIFFSFVVIICLFVSFSFYTIFSNFLSSFCHELRISFNFFLVWFPFKRDNKSSFCAANYVIMIDRYVYDFNEFNFFFKSFLPFICFLYVCQTKKSLHYLCGRLLVCVCVYVCVVHVHDCMYDIRSVSMIQILSKYDGDDDGVLIEAIAFISTFDCSTLIFCLHFFWLNSNWNTTIYWLPEYMCATSRCIHGSCDDIHEHFILLHFISNIPFFSFLSCPIANIEIN